MSNVTDTQGNECTIVELHLIYAIAEECPGVPNLTGVLSYPEFIKMARWCLLAGGTLMADDARKAFPLLRYRKAETVQSVLDFLVGSERVRSVLAPETADDEKHFPTCDCADCVAFRQAYVRRLLGGG